jgi:hypothetical protein
MSDTYNPNAARHSFARLKAVASCCFFCESTLLDQHQDRHGGKLLGDRRQPKHHIGRERHAQLQVGEAIGAAEHWAPIFDHDNCGAMLV